MEGYMAKRTVIGARVIPWSGDIKGVALDYDNRTHRAYAIGAYDEALLEAQSQLSQTEEYERAKVEKESGHQH
jgi:hypothetical protein